MLTYRTNDQQTTNLIINLDHDEWILEDGSKALSEVGFENETEASFFNRAAYEAFKLNPQTRWDGFENTAEANFMARQEYDALKANAETPQT